MGGEWTATEKYDEVSSDGKRSEQLTEPDIVAFCYIEIFRP